MVEAKKLHCPADWTPVITNAMAAALPAPRSAGPDAVRVGIMVRQSKAREDDSQGSPRAQLDAGLHLVQSPARSAWHVSPENVFADIGVSGWSSGVKRPGFDAMMTAVREDRLDVVIVYSLSRLSRKGALDVLNIIAEFAEHGTRLVSVTEPWLDTDAKNPVGQAILGLTAALAQQESAQKSLYITDTHAQSRKRGGHVAGRAPYGMKAERVMIDGMQVTKLVPDPETAPNVLDMIDWTMSEKLDRREIATRLTEKGVPTPTGKGVWIVPTVRAILRDPRIAGYSVEAFTRVETDEEGRKRRRPVTSSHAILYGPDGAPVELHEGIVSRVEWWELQTFQGVDANRIRVRAPRETGAPGGLFTRLGKLFCGVCGRPLQSNPGGKNGRYPFYTCNTGPGGPLNAGRHSMGVTMVQVDDEVPRMAFRWLAELDPDDAADAELLVKISRRFAMQTNTEERTQQLMAAKRELTHVQAVLRNLVQDREAGVYDGPTMQAEYRSSVSRLTNTELRLLETIKELTAEDANMVALPAEWFQTGSDPIGPGSPWADWDMETRRSFILTVVDRAAVLPVGRKGNHMAVADRLRIDWTGTRADRA